MNVYALEPPEEDDDSYEWYEFIEDMLTCSEYDFAFDFLTDVAEKIEYFENITEGQKEGVMNVYYSVIRRAR